jgi:hypothetical protein
MMNRIGLSASTIYRFTELGCAYVAAGWIVRSDCGSAHVLVDGSIVGGITVGNVLP